MKKMWFDKADKKTALLLIISFLVSLTILASVPVNIIGPFDAITNKPVNCAKVNYSPIGTAAEPLTALAHIISDAPDVRLASISTPLWIVGLTIFTSAAVQLRKNRWRANRQTINFVFAVTYRVILIVATYGMFSLLVRIPNWQAVSTDPNIILAELHTHTFGSFDAIVSAKDCLRWHKQRGCRVVAVTDHDSFEGGLKAAELAEKDESLPAVIPGIELNIKGLNTCAALGPKEQLANFFEKESKEPNLNLQMYQGPFISWFKQDYQGVVLALNYQLRKGRAEKLVQAGVDGFNIVNEGHPCIKADTQAEILAAGTANHLPFVAFSDWHGYGGILRTWTAIRIPDAAKLSRQELATAVLDILRRHDYSKITPLVEGNIGRVTSAEIIFAPFVESIRYALGLTPLRLLAWWFWGFVLFLIATWLMNLGFNPPRLIWALATASLGIVVIIYGLRLVIAHYTGDAPFPYPLHFGLEAILLGATAVLAGIIDAYFTIRKRQKTLIASHGNQPLHPLEIITKED